MGGRVSSVGKGQSGSFSSKGAKPIAWQSHARESALLEALRLIPPDGTHPQSKLGGIYGVAMVCL